MMADVPTADVVVVNPTHFAVALRYDGSKPAPGGRREGRRPRRRRDPRGSPRSTACRSSRTRRSPGRSTAQVELGAQIPEELFVAVAEVLAYVFRTAPAAARRAALAPALKATQAARRAADNACQCVPCRTPCSPGACSRHGRSGSAAQPRWTISCSRVLERSDLARRGRASWSSS